MKRHLPVGPIIKMKLYNGYKLQLSYQQLISLKEFISFSDDNQPFMFGNNQIYHSIIATQIFTYLSVWINYDDLFRFLSFISTCNTVLCKHFLFQFTLPPSHRYIFLSIDSRSSVSSMPGHVSILTDDCSPGFVSLVLTSSGGDSAKLSVINNYICIHLKF